MIMNDFLNPNIKFQTMYYDDAVVKVGIFIPPEFFQSEVFKDLTASSFKVLMVLLSHMSNTTYSCYPSIEKICSLTNLTKPCVCRCLKQLKEMGILSKITKTKSKSNSQYLHNTYYFNKKFIEAVTVEMIDYSDLKTKQYYSDLEDGVSMDDLIDDVEEVE